MSDPEMRTDPPGTVYGARRTVRPGLPRDPLMRTALAVALFGVLLGVLFASGVLTGGSVLGATEVGSAAGGVG
ncbi:hypothetical protein DKL51_24305, partial [Micromonospora globispora]